MTYKRAIGAAAHRPAKLRDHIDDFADAHRAAAAHDDRERECSARQRAGTVRAIRP